MLLDWPSPVFPHGQRGTRGATISHSHPMSQWLVRLVLTLCPPLLIPFIRHHSKKHAHIAYWHEGHYQHYLDVIVSRKVPAKAPMPVFIFVHGGGWVIGSKDRDSIPLAHFVAQAQWVVVTINYRFVELYDDAFIDIFTYNK